MRCLALPALLLTLAGSAATAQPQPSLDLTPDEAAEALRAMAPTNAALVYYQLFMVEDKNLNLAAEAFYFEPPDLEHLPMSVEDSARLLAKSQDTIERIVWAAGLPECDFGLLYQDGWAMLLPQLSKLRNMARVLRADAVRLGELGEHDKAAERAGAMFGLADQVRRDRVLISSLVSIAIAKLAVDTADYLAEHDQLTAEGRDLLIARAEALRGDDYFGLLDCMTMEYTVSSGWLADLPEGVKPSSLLRDSGLVEGEDRVFDRLDSMSRAALCADAEKMAEYYKNVRKVWDDPKAVEKLQGLGALAEPGAFGETGKLFVAAMDRTKASELRFYTALDETLPRLIAYRPPETDEQPDPAEVPATEPGARQ